MKTKQNTQGSIRCQAHTCLYLKKRRKKIIIKNQENVKSVQLCSIGLLFRAVVSSENVVASQVYSF